MNKDNRFLDWFCVKVLPLAIQRSDNNFADLAQKSVSLIWESCGKIRFFTESASPALGPVQSARPLGGGEIMRTLLLALPLFLCLSHYSQPRPSISVDHHYHRWPTFSVKLSRRFQNSMFIFPVCGEKRCCWVLGMGWHKWRGWGRWWKGGGEARTGCWGQKYLLLNVLRRQNWLSEQRLYDVVGALLCHHTSTDVVHSMFCFIQIIFFWGRNILLFVFQLKICLLKFHALTSSQESLLKLLKQYQCHWCHLFHKRVTLESDIH